MLKSGEPKYYVDKNGKYARTIIEAYDTETGDRYGVYTGTDLIEVPSFPPSVDCLFDFKVKKWICKQSEPSAQE